MEYYFVATALPTLSLGTKPEISFAELRTLYALNLLPRDFAQVEKLLLSIDVANLRALWQELPFDDRGTLPAKELEAAVLVKEGVPPFVVEFLERYDSTEERLRNFGSLQVALTDHLLEQGGFLARYAAFERELRLVLAGARAKRLARDLVRELQFEDPFDPAVASILAQKDAPDYTPPSDYEELIPVFSLEPKEQERELLAYRLDKIEEMEGTEPFSLDHLLGYMARLVLLETWNALNESEGISLIQELSKHG